MAARTAVNQQPGGGTLYPFAVDPAAGLLDAILDAYLSYEDDVCVRVLPFDLTVTAAGADFTTSVTDANGDDVVDAVFDSTEAATTVWGSDRTVYEWVGSTYVFRLVVADAGITGLSNAVGVLDPRVLNRLPGRVRSFRLGSQVLDGDIVFMAGNNVALSVEDPENGRSDGGRYATRLLMDAVPGAGEGREEGCLDGDQAIRKVNQITPDAAGNFVIELDDCYRAQLAVAVTGAEDDVRAALYESAGLTTAQAKAAIALFNDCRPCCPCTYFVRTYKGLKRMWDRWKTVAVSAEAARDTFTDNIDRWTTQAACRTTAPLRTVLKSQPGCKTFAGAYFCNTTRCCLTNILIRFTFQYYENGVETAWPGGTVTEAYLIGANGNEAYAPTVSGQVYTFAVETAEPFGAVVAGLKLCVACQPDPDDEDPPELTIRMTATVQYLDPPSPNQDGNECVVTAADVPDDIAGVWTDLELPSTPTIRGVAASAAVPLNPEPKTFDCSEC